MQPFFVSFDKKTKKITRPDSLCFTNDLFLNIITLASF